MTHLRKLVPAPLTSAAILMLWVALARVSSGVQILLGIVLALSVPLLTSRLRPTTVRVKHPLIVARYILTVAWDVVLSNFHVAWGVVRWPWRRSRSAFIVVPLDLRDPLGLAALSMVTTVVPGTVWSELALDRSALLLHVWEVGEEHAFVTRFKARYEAPLREIFE
jgi:multicomponent K+:H+ antiporter subunit E